MKLEPCPHGVARTRKSKDGLTAQCHECLKQRDRNRANNPERVQARKEYQKTDAFRESCNKAARKYDSSPMGRKRKQAWRDRNPKKQKAHEAVAYQIRLGNIEKESCESCGDDNTHAHHDDYDKQLEIRWLCPGCHKQWHKDNGEGENAK